MKQQSPGNWVGGFSVLNAERVACDSLVGKKLRLSWRYSGSLLIGQIVTARVKLKPPWGTLNVGGFDYRRWLVAKGYSGTGYIRQGDVEPVSAINPRERLSSFVRERLSQSRFTQAPGLLALAIGDQNRVSPAHWERLRKTGTIHLFVISGLHVALVGGWLFLLCHAVLRLLAACIPNAIPAHQVGVLLSFCGVAAYAWLSGLNPPVVRAAVMAALAVLGLLMSRRTTPLRILFGTFFLTLFLQPLSVLQQGFWLSYAAVAVLCWGVIGHQRQSGGVYTFLRAQIVLFLCMAPLLGVLVGAVPFISIPANIMAVPVVTLVTLPSLLLGLLFTKVSSVVSDWLLAVADISLTSVFNMLDWFLSVVPLQLQSFGYFSPETASVAGVAALVICIPVSLGLRFVVGIGLLPMLLANATNL